MSEIFSYKLGGGGEGEKESMCLGVLSVYSV